MKRKFSKILGVGLTVALLASLVLAVVPVSAGTLSWSTVTIPSTVNNVLTPGEHIADLAASGETVYAVMGTSANKTYVSTDTGETWKELSAAKATTSFPAYSFMLVTVAPDDGDVVAVVTENGSVDTVEYSVNGGSSWTNLGEPVSGITILSIDMSQDASGYRYLAVGGYVGSDGVMYTIKLATGETWTARHTGGTGFRAGQERVSAVKFSPNFATDKIITAVSQNATGNACSFQIMWYESPYNWNAQVTGYADYGTGIAQSAVTVNGTLTSASISLFPDYLGTDDETRIAFVGLATASDGGVARFVDNNQDKEVVTWTSASTGGVHSVVYDGTLLLAGDYNSTKVWVSSDPMATTPKFGKVSTYKQCGGVDKTNVAWAGDNVVAGTSGSGSAFAVSTDDGESFNDISLIDAALTNIRDITPSMDGSILYMSTDDGSNTSIWLRASSWKRVLSINSATNYIVRASPEDASVVYAVDVGGTDVYFSSNAGEVKWNKRPCYKLDDIVDMVVESDTVAYAVDANESSKTTNAGSSWVTAKALGVTANMISLAPGGDLLVGGADGYVAYSEDSASTWEVTEKMVGGVSGNVQVIADADYENNDYIFASTDTDDVEGIYRAKTTTATSFSQTYGLDLDDAASGATNAVISGLAQHGGILYAVWNDGTSSYLERVMNPTADVPSYATEKGSTGEIFNVGPGALKVSDGVILWAINDDATTTDELYSLTDLLVDTAPALVAPADGASVPVNPASGEPYNVTFSFDRPEGTSDKVKSCQLRIYDSEGARIYSYDIAVTATTTTKVIGPKGATNYICEFMPGETYTWKVRVSAGGPFYSSYSDTRSFTVDEMEVTPTVEILPAPPAPQITVEPKVEVVMPPTPPAPPVQVTKEVVTPGWIWAIIVIGAVLAIAVLVLIVRTRRVV